jgi:hypothetical protein
LPEIPVRQAVAEAPGKNLVVFLEEARIEGLQHFIQIINNPLDVVGGMPHRYGTHSKIESFMERERGKSGAQPFYRISEVRRQKGLDVTASLFQFLMLGLCQGLAVLLFRKAIGDGFRRFFSLFAVLLR